MSAWLNPTWGRAAEVFSTLTAITGLPLTLPPVSGLAGLGSGSGLVVADDAGVGVGLAEPTEVDGPATGAGSEPPRTTANAIPPPASTSAATAAATVWARLHTKVL